MGELWAIHASREACDLAVRAPGAGRVAPDEVFVAGPLPADLRAAIAKVDPEALIRDTSEGWEEIVLDVRDARDVLPRLSELRFPEPSGYVQGDVARVAVRAYVHEDRVSLFVRAPWAEFLRRRLAQERDGR